MRGCESRFPRTTSGQSPASGNDLRMASPESPHSPVDQFYVLKQGGMHGPFTREELRERFSGGHLDMEDFVQMEGVPIWQPLARILGNEDTCRMAQSRRIGNR